MVDVLEDLFGLLVTLGALSVLVCMQCAASDAVSILCVTSKIPERVEHEQMYEYVNKLSLMYDFQSGFRKRYSTDSCLLYLSDFIRKAIDEGNLGGMVLLDLEKAFDTVNHWLLIYKLEALGLSNIPLGSVKSYLSGREQVLEVSHCLRKNP